MDKVVITYIVSVALALVIIFCPIVIYPLAMLFILIGLFFWKPSTVAMAVFFLTADLIPYEKLPKLNIFGGHFFFTDIAMFTVLFLSILALLIKIKPRYIFKRSGEYYAAYLFLLIVFIAFLRSTFYGDPHIMLREIRPFFYFAVSIFVFAATINTETVFKEIVKFLVVLTIIISFTQIIEAVFGVGFTGSRINTADLEGGVILKGINRVYLSGITFLFFSTYFLAQRLFEKSNRTVSIFGVFLFALATLFSLGRARLLTFFAGFIFLYFFIPSAKKTKYIKGIFIILVFVIFIIVGFNSLMSVASVRERFVSIFNSETYSGESLGWRYSENQDALRALKHNLTFGIGFGRSYRNLSENFFSGDFSYIHNGYLFYMLKLGLLGTIAFFWMIFSYCRKILKVMDKISDSFLMAFSSASIIALLCLLIVSINQPEISLAPALILIAFFMKGRDFILTDNRNREI